MFDGRLEEYYARRAVIIGVVVFILGGIAAFTFEALVKWLHHHLTIIWR